MSNKQFSSVLLEPGRLEIQQFPIPIVSQNDGVLKTEVSGICGSDVYHFRHHTGPIILGHEIVGTIFDIGNHAAEFWSVKPGDRVVVEATFGCGFCDDCRLGHYRLCSGDKGYGGAVTSEKPPHLWGGLGEYVYLPPTARVHKIPDSISAEVAVLVCAVLGNGIRWFRTVGGVSIGDTAVVVGPGPQGLASTIAARESGAKNIVVIGMEKDDARLRMAERLGATHTVTSDSGDPMTLVSDLTGGRMAEVAIDVTNSAVSPTLALDLVGRQGTLVLAGGRGNIASQLHLDRITAEEIRIFGVNSQDSPSVRKAISIAESGRYPLGDIVSHRFRLDEVENAIRTLSGDIPSEGLIKIVVYPELQK